MDGAEEGTNITIIKISPTNIKEGPSRHRHIFVFLKLMWIFVIWWSHVSEITKQNPSKEHDDAQEEAQKERQKEKNNTKAHADF
jgi:hypothetical protein